MNPSLLEVLLKHNACTRLADLTGFTPLDLPVWACIRPNGKSGSSTVGKGMVETDSKLSALFECYELTCAERLQFEQHCKTSSCTLHFMFHPLYLEATSELEICIGRSLLTGKEVLIPFGYLSMDTTKRDRAYLCSTIGTGAGYRPEQAAESAIREFLERYSIHHKPVRPLVAKRISYSGLEREGDSKLIELLHICHDNDCEIIFQDYTSIDGWPCFSVRLFCWQVHSLMVGNGYGCDRNPAKALLQAILEAHQGICVGVSGMRDDMIKSTYLSSRSEKWKWERDLQSKYPVTCIAEVFDTQTNDVLIDEATLLSRLVLFEYPSLDPNQPFACCKALMPI